MYECMQMVIPTGRAIVLGDFNAKSQEWGFPSQDKRSQILSEWAAAKDLVVLNTGDPTCARGHSKTHIDVTMATRATARHITGWRVINDETVDYYLKVTTFLVKDQTLYLRTTLKPEVRTITAGFRQDHTAELEKEKYLTPTTVTDIIKRVLVVARDRGKEERLPDRQRTTNEIPRGNAKCSANHG